MAKPEGVEVFENKDYIKTPLRYPKPIKQKQKPTIRGAREGHGGYGQVYAKDRFHSLWLNSRQSSVPNSLPGQGLGYVPLVGGLRTVIKKLTTNPQQ